MRLLKFGPNVVTRRRGTPEWKRFLLQFHAPLVYILLAAAGITAWLGEWIDSSVIFGVVFVNAIIGYIQESKAEHAIEALSRLVLTQTTVRRSGRRRRVPSEQLVPGDVVLLQSGDRVPADLRSNIRAQSADRRVCTYWRVDSRPQTLRMLWHWTPFWPTGATSLLQARW